MAQDKITVFFDAKGDEKLIKAINALAKAQGRLGATTDKLTKQTQRNTKTNSNASKGFFKVGGTVSVVRSKLLVYSFAVGLVTKGVQKLVGSLIEQENAEKKLEVALGKTSNELLNQASALQKVTTFGDEAIIGVQASIAAFTDSEEQIKKATEATLDIATAMGMDLKAAGDLVAKTLGSSTNAISRYGINVEGAVGSTERLESLTKNVADLFGGQAKAQTDTMAGAIQQMDNAVGDAAEELGEVLAPIVITTARGLKFLAESVGSVLSRFRNFGKEVDQLIGFVPQANIELENFRETISMMSKEDLEKMNEEMKKTFKNMQIITPDIELQNQKYEILKEKLQKLIGLEALRNGIVKEELTLRREDIDFTIEKIKQNEIIQEDMRDQIKLSGALQQALSTAFDPDLGAGEAFKGFILQLLSAMQGVILASKAVSEALTFSFSGPIGIATAIGSLAALEIAKAGVRSIKFAETGFDGVVNQPTMFVTGEAGAERVQVTPLQGPNINGPKGGEVVINISAPLVDETIVDTIIPAIQKAQKMNLA